MHVLKAKDMIDIIQAREVYNVGINPLGAAFKKSTSSSLQPPRPFSIAIDNNWKEAIAQMSELPGDQAVSVYVFDAMFSTDALCMEYFLSTDDNIDAFIPTTDPTKLRMARSYTVIELEQRLGIHIIMPEHEANEAFSDKTAFAAWIAGHSELVEFIPKTYDHNTAPDFPVFVKEADGFFGGGTSLASTPSELNAILANTRGDYVMQEAIPGQDFLSIYFMTRLGKVLATTCLYYHFPDRLGIMTYGYLPPSVLVPCREFEAVSPSFDLVHHIVKESAYNGFGCMQYKLIGTGHTVVDHVAYFHEVDQSSDDALTTDFSFARPMSDNGSSAAHTKILEINTRICGGLLGYPAVMRRMIQAYVDK